MHLAFDEVEHREVAIKLIDRRFEDMDQLKRRLLREARATQVLDPARVARAERVGEAAGEQLYVIMPFVRGQTVRERVQRGPLSPEEALGVLREVATTLDAAHAAGLVHRDVKPDNVMIGDDGRVVLLDFGIVKALSDGGQTSGAAFASTALTGSGALLGTLSYVAPEQALGEEVDARVDQFGLAVMAFELLTGRLPWAGDLAARVLAQILYEPAPAASSIRPDLGAAADDVLARALCKQREGRFASVGAFISALEDAVRHGIAPAPSMRARPAVTGEAPLPLVRAGGGRVRSAARLVALVAAGVAAVGAVAFAIELRAHPAPVKWASSGRGTLAVPLATLDARAPCADWLSGALAEGLTSQLAAGGKTRAVGPRELGVLAQASSNRKGIRAAFGADAILQAECARPRTGDDGAVVRVRVTSAAPDGRELASFDVSGSARAPSDLVARVADQVRERLGIGPLDPIERARAERTLPQSPDAARAYVEGLAKLDVFDAEGARAAFERAIGGEAQFAPAHAALANSYVYLGEQRLAAKESKIAAANASSLPNEDRLLVEGDAAAVNYEWDKAIETYRAIVKVFPDRTDVALKLIQAYIDSSQAKGALAAIADLKARTGSDEGDPRLYLASARAESLVGKSAEANELAEKAETLAEQVGLTNVRLQAIVLRCHLNAELVAADGENVCAEAERLATAAGDRMGVLRSRLSAAYVLAQRADFAGAERAGSEVVAFADQIGSPYARASALGTQALIAKRKGDLATARDEALAAIAQADESGNGYSRASNRIILAGSLLDAGSLEEGRKYYEEALAIAQEMGDEATTAVVEQNLASYWLRKGNITLARQQAERSLALCERAGNEMDTPWALDEVGLLVLESGEPAKARDLFAEAMTLRGALKLPLSSSRQNHASSLLDLGDLDGALQEITATVDEDHQAGLRLAEEQARVTLVRVVLARGDATRALAECDTGLALARELQQPDGDFTAPRIRATYLAGRHREALEAMTAALAQTPDPMSRWDLHLVEGELLLRAGARDRALNELRTLLTEVHAGGDFRTEKAVTALLDGNLDGGYR